MCINKKPYDDDGRSFADMHVDGMPWFARLGAKPDRSNCGETLSPSERRHALLGIFAAIATVVLIFGAVFFIVIALMAKP